jgi:RNA polymerase sigma-70 factor (ECF subfamily)
MSLEKEFLENINVNQKIIYKLVGLYAIDDEEKKDFHQEIIYQAWKSFPTFRKESKFSTWLYQISINTLLTIKRKKNIFEYKDTLEKFGKTNKYSNDEKENAQQLYTAIKQLEETDIAIITLHLEGYSANEISTIIGITTNYVGVKLLRIKDKLLKILKKI